MYKELINDIVLKNFKTKIFDIEEVSKFGNAKVFLVKIKYKKYVIRITKDPYSIFNNSYALKLLSKLDFTPKLIANGVISEFQYSIETFIEGREVVKMDIQNIKSIFYAISKVHNHESEKCGYLNDLSEDWTSFVKLELIEPYVEEFIKKRGTEKIVDFLLNNLPSSTLKYSFLHGDFNESNILIRRKESFVFDFESAFYGDKEYDIGYFLFRIGISRENIELIKEKYDIQKVLYYALCISIRKIALAKDFESDKGFERLNAIYKLVKKK